jgi:glycogen(starch) synthase
MRILLVSEDIPYANMGGLAKHVLGLARALREAGHDVDLLGGSQHTLSIAGAEGEFGGQFYGELAGQFAGWKERQLGVIMPPKRPWIARQFAAVILRHAPHYDVIHYHGHLPNIGRYIPARINFVQTRHDQGSDCVLHTRFRDDGICTATAPGDCAACFTAQPNALQRAISRSAVLHFRREVRESLSRHKTVFVSDMLRHNLRRTFGPGNWGVTIHNFADRGNINAASAACPPPPQDEGLRIVVAGKITPAKGTAAFLQTLLPQLPSRMHVSLIGDGPSEAALRSACAGQPRIQFHGWCSARQTLHMTAAAHAVVVPSLWEEPFGTTILEGLLLGKPTFALARGGTPEIARYTVRPDQLRLHSSVQEMVLDLVSHESFNDYGLAPDGLGDVRPVAAQLLQVYRCPPGPLAASFQASIQEETWR